MAELENLEGAYLNHHVVRSSSPKTIDHYRNTFVALHQFLDERKLRHDSTALSTDTIAETKATEFLLGPKLPVMKNVSAVVLEQLGHQLGQSLSRGTDAAAQGV